MTIAVPVHLFCIKVELLSCGCMPLHTSQLAVYIHLRPDSYFTLYVVTNTELCHLVKQQ